MKFISRGFTLVELMIVIAIIGILVAVLFPNLTRYYSRGRDVQRISDIRSLSQIFQNYARILGNYPDNTNPSHGSSHCVTEIMLWENENSLYPDRQYQSLGGTGTLQKDPNAYNTNIGLCLMTGSYFYSRIDVNQGFGVVAARMENQTTGANWTGALSMTNPLFIDAMQKSTPLDKYGDDTDKLFIIISN